MQNITPEELHRIFHYNPETGDLSWRVGCRKITAGTTITCVRPDGYRVVGVGYTTYRAHRIIWAMQTGAWPTETIDHKNGVRSDNRWENLREATKSQNNVNKIASKKSKTGVRGVTVCNKTGHFYSRINFEKKSYYLGYYRTLEEAKSAYEKAAKELHGLFRKEH